MLNPLSIILARSLSRPTADSPSQCKYYNLYGRNSPLIVALVLTGQARGELATSTQEFAQESSMSASYRNRPLLC